MLPDPEDKNVGFTNLSILFDFKKDKTASDFTPKFILSICAVLIPATATATSSPVFSSTIGPPLLPWFNESSICI